MPDIDIFKHFAEGAQQLGAMQATAVWAFVCMIMSVYIWRINKHHESYDRQWQEIRNKEAEADIKMSIAIEKLDQIFEKQSDDISEIRVILDERLPRGGHSV